MGALVTGILAFFVLFLSTVDAKAQFEFISLPSSVPGVKIRNFHYVLKDEGLLYRGSQPRGKEHQARQVVGINEVLILKNEFLWEVQNELAAWDRLGLPPERVHHIPFEWDNRNEELACRQLIDALQIAKTALRKPETRFYIHCTAGEDRTGVFIGMIRMLKEKWRYERAFEEMCSYGYADGNSWKPFFITNRVKAGLTPLFLKMAYFIENRRLTWQHLDGQICAEIDKIPPIDVPHRFNCR